MPNYVQYFGSNIVEGVAESWVEAEMSWVEVDGARSKLKWAGWKWMELGGAGWSWVHGLVIPLSYRTHPMAASVTALQTEASNFCSSEFLVKWYSSFLWEFPWDFQVFLSLCGPNFVKSLEFKSNTRTRLKKCHFSSKQKIVRKTKHHSHHNLRNTRWPSVVSM